MIEPWRVKTHHQNAGIARSRTERTVSFTGDQAVHNRQWQATPVRPKRAIGVGIEHGAVEVVDHPPAGVVAGPSTVDHRTLISDTRNVKQSTFDRVLIEPHA